MPNGDPNFDFVGLDRFFAPLSDALEYFAKRHNLNIEKYYHEAPSWNLTFRHPERGVAKIDITRKDDDHVCVQEMWWFDDYDKLTRSIRRWNREPVRAMSYEVQKEVELALKDILAWQFGTWDAEYSGYKNWRKTWTKSQFYELEKQYPLPIP